METINDRVKIIRNILKMNQTEFGKTLAVSQNYLSNIEKGYRDVTEKIFKIICLEFNVNDEWLRNGSGEIFKESNICSLDEYARLQGASKADIEILKIYLNLDKHIREQITVELKKIFMAESSSTSQKQKEKQI